MLNVVLPKILVTGASGKTGAAVVAQLRERDSKRWRAEHEPQQRRATNGAIFGAATISEASSR